MANECNICGDRRIETCMMVLGGTWCEFCALCADAVCLQNAEGERKTPREVWDSIEGATPCPFPARERFEPTFCHFAQEDDFPMDEYDYMMDDEPFEALPPADLEDRETLMELPVRSMSCRRAWERDGFISAKGSKGRGWKKPRNRLRDKRLAA